MALELPRGVAKLPRGLFIHGTSLQIRFSWKGERFKEPLEGISQLTKANIAYADNKRRTILTEIKEGRFNFEAHFPNSPRLAKIKSRELGIKDFSRTVGEGVTSWLQVQETTKAKSTYQGYVKKARYVQAKFKDQKIANITKTQLELFQAELLKKGLSPKTVNDTFTVIRAVWSEAFSDGVISANPMDRIKNIERDNLEESADPFTRAELERIAATKTLNPENVNMVMFWCWSGLSLSEIIALAWEDIDQKEWIINIRRARVSGQFKAPKERSRNRVIELVDPAIEWLQKQMAYTLLGQPRVEKVIQRDNITSRNEQLRLVFTNGPSGLAWTETSIRRWFQDHLKKAQIRYRGPNQCRHTFASQLLSAYVPLEWIARQLGHSDTTMVKRHYGRWIPKDALRQADRISKMLSGNMSVGSTPDQGTEQKQENGPI